MALKAVQRRLIEPGVFSSGACPSCRFASILKPRISQRGARVGRPTMSEGMRRSIKNPTIDDFIKKRPSKSKEPETITVQRGTPSTDSIFDDEDLPPTREEVADEPNKSVFEEIDPEALMNVLDPDPTGRLRWERKKIIQQIRKRGQLTKEEVIKRTERECKVSSQTFKTSTKKLVHLARQIAGKPIDEAILQMRFSKKRVAQDVMKHLEYARNMAIVSRGMGLGKAEGREGAPIEIELKDGKRKLITDRTGVYVDQAWVNKGLHSSTIEYRARGRQNMLRHRRASITVILKEEATRIRLYEEREKKRANRKVWLHLPDRPITLQRQYPLW